MRSVQLILALGAFVGSSLLIDNVAAQKPSAAPNPGFPPCVVCGGEHIISRPSGTVSFPGIEVLDCRTVEDAGLQGFIDPAVCGAVVSFLGNCRCAARTLVQIVTASPTRAPISPDPTTMLPTETQAPSGIVPTDSPAPSPNPTDTFAPSPSPTDSPRPTPIPTITEIPSKEPTESPRPSPAPSFDVTVNPTNVPTESPQPSPSPSAFTPTQSPRPSSTPTGLFPTDSPAPSPAPSAPPSSMSSFPETPSPSEDCGGVRNDPCTADADCCSNTCQRKPGQAGGICLSSKTASKNDVKLGNDKGGAGNQSKRQ